MSEGAPGAEGTAGSDTGIAVSHVGICVSDIDASLRFYCEGLGFTEVADHEVGEEFAALMEVEGVRLRSRMIRRDGVTLELLGYAAPGTVVRPIRTTFAFGETSLDFLYCTDPDGVRIELMDLGS